MKADSEMIFLRLKKWLYDDGMASNEMVMKLVQYKFYVHMQFYSRKTNEQWGEQKKVHGVLQNGIVSSENVKALNMPRIIGLIMLNIYVPSQFVIKSN